jgi:hypothetical protein
MTHFEWLIIIKSSDFLTILKNSKKILKNIKFNPQLDFQMKNILTGRIGYLNFENGETVRSTRVIRATRSTLAKLSLSLYIYIQNSESDDLWQKKILLLSDPPIS